MRISLKKSRRESSAKPKVVVVLGPNASGKSSIGIELAKRHNGEIISADSRQIYKGLDIGAGKIMPHEMDGIPHHMLDVTSPGDVFTVAEYQRLAKKILEDILKRGKLPIIVGGTGFYIDALIYDIDFPKVPPQPELRESLETMGVDELFNLLKKADPNRASTIDPRNKRRLVRALEIIEYTGKPVPPADKQSNYDVLKIGVGLSVDILKERIEKRLDNRLENGMVEETKKLIKNGVSLERLDELGLEYRYLSYYIDKKITREEMRDTLLKEIQYFAKRQMTWFKRDKEIIWIDPSKDEASSHGKAFQVVQDFLSP